ncbi:hypothetical protein PV379_10505 [Streptomyces caniscabiei]|uniref:hypothetical protein n=1 Tax=Streptomyces caniscabiei TaxID=2746961 RepID=UPI0029A7A7B4|nr:hypothetical protein [Streptomyces caniscabiei]MDX2606249.1 hypothetical protein [Streptomyces caniscabiei]MDX2741451.1 hypothetical protein [Streptomyces caniscabiei]MDX2777742.1 hypothetical protein [Streptomyces caniscabiei]
MSDPQQAWLEWLRRLDLPRKAAAESLRAQFSALGVTDPVDLIKSEVMEDVPQLARFVLLRSLWHGAIDDWTEPGSLDQLPAAQRLLAAGSDREDLVRLVRAVAYEAVFATLDELDAGGDVNVSGVEAGWVVMESGEDGSPTGRALSGLHEDLLTMDPSGRDGADLWQ